MREYLKQRILEEARYIAETKSTVRHTAKVFLSSKSTVHKDVTIWNDSFGWNNNTIIK